MLKRNKLLSSILTVLFLMTVVLSSTVSATNYTVGLGSYTDTLTSGFVGPQSTIYKTSNMTGATPTNDWHSSVVWGQYSQVLYAHPLAFKCVPTGLEVSYPKKTTWVNPNGDGDTDIVYEHSSPDFTVQATTFAPTEARADKITDWGIDILMPNGANNIKATLAHGSPFAYFTYTGGNPKVVFAATPTVFSGNSSSQYLGVTINGNNYGLFAPAGSTWSGIGTGTITCNLPSGSDFFSIAVLPDQTSLETFKNYAYAFITNTEVSWVYNQSASTITTTFKVTTSPKGGTTNTSTIFALYPHQWRNNSLITPLTYTYRSARGTMKTVSGTQFQTQYKYTGILPWLPAAALSNSATKATIQGHLDDFEGYGSTLNPKYIIPGEEAWQYGGYDTYWLGKNFGRLYNLIPIARQTGDTVAANEFMTSMRNTLEWWFKAEKYNESGAPVNDNYFYYDKNWGTLIGYHASYGTNTSLNDHHFHYGYWLNAAASVVLNSDLAGSGIPSDWGSDAKWGGMVKEIVSDIANTDRSNTKYPFLRNFDPYAGHSWASGDCNFTADTRYINSGNNNESSSEAINAWASLILWGEATGNTSIRDTGIYLYTTEIQAVNNYWFDIYNDIYDETEYKNVNTGKGLVETTQIWGGRGAHTTWWTEDPIQTHGINILPVSAWSMYLGTDPNYVKRNYDATYGDEWTNYLAQKAAKGWAGNTDIYLWQDVMLQYLSLNDPALALSKWSNKRPDGTQINPEFGESYAHTLHFMNTLNTMGTPDFTITANTPLYSVFNKNGVRTYVVHNASSSVLSEVRFSNNAVIRNIPAKSMYYTSTPEFDNTTPTVPAAPTGLTATATSTSQINLAWADNATNETGYKMYMNTTNTKPATATATLAAGTTTYSSTGLTANTTYYFWVEAYNTAGSSTAATVSATTQNTTPTVPAAPTGLTATAASTSQINLAWTDNATNETGYKVYMNTTNTKPSTSTALAAGVATYSATGLTANTTYYFWVEAYNTAGSSTAATASATTQNTTPTVPAAPTGLTATAASTTQINLAWADNATNETGFKVYRNTTNSKPTTATTTLAAGATSCQCTGLTANTTYYFWVEAYNTAGSSTAATVSATTQNGSTTTLMIDDYNSATQWNANTNDLGQSIVRNGGIYNLEGDTNLYFFYNGGTSPESFDNNINRDISAYSNLVIKMNGTAGGEQSTISIILNDGTNHQVSLGTYGTVTTAYQEITIPLSAFGANLAGTKYIRFQGTGSGKTVRIEEMRLTGGGSTPTVPAAPTGLSATATSTSQVNLAWTDNATNETGYKVYTSTTTTKPTTATSTLAAGVTSYSSTGLTANTTYYFWVEAYNTAGSSTAATANAKTQAAVTVPAAPTGLTATATSTTQINLAWTDNATNETGYKVYRNTTNTKPTTATATLGAGVAAYSATGLTAATTYYFWVEAYNTAGSSTVATVSTATQSGTNLAATTWYLFNQAVSGVTPAGQNMQTTKGSLTGWQPTKVIGTTSSYWYSTALNGTYASGTWTFTLWSTNSGASSIKVDLYKVSADGVTQTLLGTQTIDVGTTGSGNHATNFTFAPGSVSLSNQRLMVKITKVSGTDVTMCYNTNDFPTRLQTP